MGEEHLAAEQGNELVLRVPDTALIPEERPSTTAQTMHAAGCQGRRDTCTATRMRANGLCPDTQAKEASSKIQAA
jgi:hypothetical protein